MTVPYIWLLFSSFSNVYHSACVWPTALKLSCVTNFDMFFLMMWFISLVDEIQFMLISSFHTCIQSIRKLKKPHPRATATLGNPSAQQAFRSGNTRMSFISACYSAPFVVRLDFPVPSVAHGRGLKHVVFRLSGQYKVWNKKNRGVRRTVCSQAACKKL